MAERTVTGTILKPDGDPVAEAKVKFRLTYIGAETDEGVYQTYEKIVPTDGNGEFTVDLWVNEDSELESVYVVTFPDRNKDKFILPSGEGSITISDLIINHAPSTPSGQVPTALVTKADRDAGNIGSSQATDWRTALSLSSSDDVEFSTVTVGDYRLHFAAVGANLVIVNSTTADQPLIIRSDNTIEAFEADGSGGATDLFNLGAGDARYLLESNNLSDLDSPSTARDNLELGTTDDVEFSSVTANGGTSKTIEMSGGTTPFILVKDGADEGLLNFTNLTPGVTTWNLPAPSGGVGTLLIDSNNLGDLGNNSTARNNLGLASNAAPSTTSVTSTSYTIQTSDRNVLVDDDTAGSEVTATLPAAATAGDGFEVVVLKKGSTANVVIDGDGSETINGQTTQTLTGQYESIKLLCDGTEWFIIEA